MVRELALRGVCVGLLLCAAACSDDDEAGGGGAAGPGEGAAPKAEPAFSREPDAVPQDQPGAEANLRAHLNLLNLAHMADVDRGGLFIDFGTPARNKYTVGNWKSGWGADGVEGDTTYTRAASVSARVYLPVSVPEGPVTLRFRVKAIGTGTLQPYFNNEALPVLRLDKSAGFAVHDVAVPRKLLRQGENYLLLRMGDTIKLDGQDVSVALDYLHVLGAAPAAPEGQAVQVSPAADAALPRYAKLVQDASVGGARRRALVASGPTTLSWHVAVPPKAALALRVGVVDGATAPGAAAGAGAAGAAPGDAQLSVTVTPEGGAPEPIYTGAASGRWQSQQLPLDKYAGKLVKLSLRNTGAAGVAWASPAVMVPKVKLEDFKPSRNTVVLLVDTLRASKLKMYNPRSPVKTPVMASIAKEGTVFEAAQSPENWTKPSVASVLTGLYPLTHGTKKTESKLPQSALMVSEAYKKAGHATATFLANGYVSDKFGFDQGWDHYTNFIRESKNTAAEHVFREAGDWIEKHKAERFFVYVQTIDPHVPYDVPKEFLEMYDAKEYTGIVSPRKTPDLLEKAKRKPPKVVFTARDRHRLESLHNAEISYHDRYLGVFIERLKKLGLYEDMTFVVVSDHGEEFYEHGSYGHGHSVYQEMIHVPLIIRRPGLVPAGHRVPETVGTLDVSPTVLRASGIPVPEVMEGRDRIDHLRGDVPAGPAVAFSDFLDDRHVIRAGRWKLVLRGHNITLFDLQEDPGEQKELSHAKHPVAMRYLRTHLGQFLGAKDRRNWLAAEQAQGADLGTQETDIDDATKAQLKQLGYAVD